MHAGRYPGMMLAMSLPPAIEIARQASLKPIVDGQHGHRS